MALLPVDCALMAFFWGDHNVYMIKISIIIGGHLMFLQLWLILLLLVHLLPDVALLSLGGPSLQSADDLGTDLHLLDGQLLLLQETVVGGLLNVFHLLESVGVHEVPILPGDFVASTDYLVKQVMILLDYE